MASYAEEQQRAYSRSAGGSVPWNTPTTSGDLVAPSQDTGISRPGTYRPTNLLPGENPNTPSTYSVPDAGTKQVPYNTVDVPARRVSTPNNQISGVPTARFEPSKPVAGALPSTTAAPKPDLNVRDNNINGGNARPSVGNGTQPNYSGSGMSGAGASKALTLGENFAKAARKLAPLLPWLEDPLFPQAANQYEDEFLKNNKEALDKAQKKASPQKKGDGYPNLPKPKSSDSFKGGQENAIWNTQVSVTYPSSSDKPNDTLDIGNVAGKILSVNQGTSQNSQGVTKSITIVYTDGVSQFSSFTQGYGWFNPQTGKNEPASSVNVKFNRVSGSPKPADEETRNFPGLNPLPVFNPIFNRDPTVQPTNPPNAQGSPKPAPSVTPGTPVTPEGKKTPESPVNPLAPLLPLIPLVPLLFPQAAPNGSPAPSGSPSLQGAPAPLGAPSSTTTPSKAPITGDKPGELGAPQPKDDKKAFTPNADPESQKCCPSQGADIAELKRVLGVSEFPAVLPILTNDGQRNINNIPDLLLWTNSNIDATQGFFPATVKVVKPDSTEKEFKLMNTAHAFEELFSALLTVAEDVDATVNIAARNATEIVNTKIAVNQGNQLLHAMQKFLGFTVLPVAKLLKINFSPTATGLDGKLQNDEMQDFLKPSQQSYVGSELGEKQEVLPMLQRILQNSEIARMAVWQPIKPGKKGEDSITGTRLSERRNKPTEAEKKEWEAYIKILRDAGYDVDDKSPSKGTTK